AAVAGPVDPPGRVERAAENASRAELPGHVDRGVEQARGPPPPLEQRVEPPAEAADGRDLDVAERQVLLEAIGHVVVTARHEADRDGHAGEILGAPDARIRTDVDRVARDTVRVGDELPHAGAGIAHAAPRARVADGLRPFQKRLVLRAGLIAARPRLHLALIDV